MDKSKRAYIVATIRPWNIAEFNERVKFFPGKWYLFTSKEQLSFAKVKSISPRYIFFPHWSYFVGKDITDFTECVCFHETDLPFGRGGSPIQNLIARGYKDTVISAIRMTDKLDAGPVYLKRPLSLVGSAEEIFIRTAGIVSGMIKDIIINEPEPSAQKGKSVMFSRRNPKQSAVPRAAKSIGDIFDHIRMLDADEYPKAFIEYGGFRYEFSRPALRVGSVEADVKITKISGGGK